MADQQDESGVPEWVVTYGDMMSLLLTFFIMLVSLSQIKKDDGSVRAMLEAISESFGRTDGLYGAPGRAVLDTSLFGKRGSRGKRPDGGTESTSRDGPRGEHGQHLGVKRLDHGTRISLGGPAYFDRFSPLPSDRMKKNLDVIARIVAGKTNRLMIRGHSTREPIPRDWNREFHGMPVRNKFDLSFARALAVAEYLSEQGVDREHLVISAAGDTEPRKPTRRHAGRLLNRRVDVFLIDSYISPPAQPVEEEAADR